MGMDIKIEDNSLRVCQAIEQAIVSGLHEAGGEFVAQAQRNSRVDTGDTKGSFEYRVNGDTVHVGSNAENAIWEEFGTGIHAESGGRTTPWVYQDRHGDFHTTRGKRGTRALTKAMKEKASVAKRLIASKLQGVGR